MTKAQVDQLLKDKATRKCKACHKTLHITEFYISYEKKIKRYAIRHKCKTCMNTGRSKEYHRDYQLKKRYNIALKDYDKKLIEQNSCCAICKTPVSKLNGNLHVDHCHDTNKVRGLLCYTCNTGIGLFKDNLDYLRGALKYLKKYKV